MCGIFGYVNRRPDALSKGAFQAKLKTLFKLSETRGKEAAGIAIATDGVLASYKDSISASEMILTEGYREFIDRVWNSRGDVASNLACIGHTRLVTNGSQVVDANNQPVDRGRVVVVHNGIITNDAEVWEASGLERVGEVDTQAAAAFIEAGLQKDASLFEIARGLHEVIYGESTFAGLFADRDILFLTSNTGSMFVCISDNGDELFFVSERVIANKVIANTGTMAGFSEANVVQVRPQDAMLVNTRTLEHQIENVESGDLPAPSIAADLAAHRRIEEKSERTREARESMQRCTRCILPETMPYIQFDRDGVCNYCRTYEPVRYRGRDALQEVLDTVPNRPGEPNCILSFSGGRDSSYGMHLMVKELGLKPIAFSYDWGMVTDLGRRNQARMCDALGVEHIWISADIKAKRDNIRRNVKAWLKRPRLGTIPLFMAGDKHFFYYANQTMKNTGLEHLFMCVNHLEKTDFKVGFANTLPKGLKKDVDVEHIHSLPLGSMVSLASYYGKEVLLNPRYVNRSIPDTLSGFGSYYMMKQPHIDLFEYLEWHEDEVDAVLKSYDWEYQEGSDSSWRIGDGTAPFYNYIYNEVAGFTEFDTLRSNQIREGHITREEGLVLARRDSQPRWDYFREYCQLINIDFEECVRAVNRMPKLYLDRD